MPYPPRGRIVQSLGLFLLVPILTAPSARASEPANRVILFAVDGLSTRGFEQAPTPTLDALAVSGAHTLQSRGVSPTKSAPGWATVLRGAGPEVHGVSSNQWHWCPFQRLTEPPSIFRVLRGAFPNAESACVHQWDDFARLIDRDAATTVLHIAGNEALLKRASELVAKPSVKLLVIHLTSVDDAGHEEGWESPSYLKALTEADRLIGELLVALTDSGLNEETVVIVASDHGGVGKDHGGDSPREILTPLFIRGPHVPEGIVLQEPVSAVDIAPVIAWALSLPRAAGWRGRVWSELAGPSASLRPGRQPCNSPVP